MEYKWFNLKRWASIILLTTVLTLLLGACGDNTPTSVPVATTASATIAGASPATVTTATSQVVKTVPPVPNGDRTGVTDTEIRIGGIAPMSSPVASLGDILRTIKAYFTMINDQGGIYGRKINYIIEDGGFDTAQPLAAAKKLVEQDKVLAISGTLALPFIQTSMRDYFDQKGVPSLPFISNLPEMYDPPHKLQFGIYPPLGPEARFVVDFAADKLGLKKLAIFYASDNPGVNVYLEPYLAEAQAKGLPAVTQIPFKSTDTDITAQLNMLKESGAEFVYAPDSSGALGPFLQGIENWPNKPKVMLTYYNNDLSIYKPLGKSAEGVYSSWYALQPDGDDPKSVQYREFMKKYLPDVPVGNFVQGGYIMAQIFVETLRRAGKDLSRETLVAAAESIVNWRDSYANNITYGPLNRLAINSFYITQYRDGKIEKVSDWYTLK
jgi:branched-chain amino acid transport system substrate-binding protein